MIVSSFRKVFLILSKNVAENKELRENQAAGEIRTFHTYDQCLIFNLRGRPGFESVEVARILNGPAAKRAAATAIPAGR
jgi:hypothetical protein